MSAKLDLTPASCQVFFLWGVAGDLGGKVSRVTDDLELLLYTHMKVADVFRDWKLYEKRYNAPTNKPAINMKTISRTLSRKHSVETTSNPDEVRLVFRTTSVLALEEEKKHLDPGAIHLFYIQVTSQ